MGDCCSKLTSEEENDGIVISSDPSCSRKEYFQEYTLQGSCIPPNGNQDGCNEIIEKDYIDNWELSSNNSNNVKRSSINNRFEFTDSHIRYKIDYTVSFFLTETLSFPTTVHVILHNHFEGTKRVLSTSSGILFHKHDIISISGSALTFGDSYDEITLEYKILNERNNVDTELKKIKIFNEGTKILFTQIKK